MDKEQIFKTARKKNLIRLLDDELKNIRAGQEDCLDDGLIKEECRIRFSILVSKEEAFIDVIEYMRSRVDRKEQEANLDKEIFGG